jgi:Tol biopolymer transport system component
LLAPGIVSTSDDEVNTAISPDGRSLYFTKKAARKNVIVVSKLIQGKWSTPEVASFSGLFSDIDPYFSVDGTKLFFCSNRPISGDEPKKDFDIWVVEKTRSGWSEPKNVGSPINSDTDEYYPAIAADGTLYFSATRSDSKGRFDLYRSHLVDGKYGEPKNLGDLNSPTSEADCYIAPDQSFIIFASYGRPEGLGDGDLYVSFNKGGSWTKPVNLGAGLNSIAREYAPIGSPDGQTLFFTSERGFQDNVPARPYTYRDFQRSMKSTYNGQGNIYRIEMSEIMQRLR